MKAKLFPLNKITVIGPGLIGGSIAKACIERALCKNLAIGARDDELNLLTKSGLKANLYNHFGLSVEGSDLVILCVPFEVLESILLEIKDYLGPETIVTDVTSIKKEVIRLFQSILADKVEWIGSHPMAGSEKSGFESSNSKLFDGSITILTPGLHACSETLHCVKTLWEKLGSKTINLSAEEHDALVSEISHLPHLLSAVLMKSVSLKSLALAGPGFRDITRIASGCPNLWKSILLTNRQSICEAGKKFIMDFEEALEILQTGDEKALLELLNKANVLRKGLEKK
ncbi:prephenate dehydrogenase [Methylacidiphilum caldifontis]|uniref:Prephenate dehydrogenase n=1 Tax=Methylacidiphilum caldifontis TaxID=2795386 RepID=A0A4Y8PC30_9BACT|nr:prephenate dehydrogenase/arogenate dehydrogenase family protein [Methylacidiphilum caldifontis]QSR88181.1 prephenate dehydrogenase/arogenate dehydrogenase family protein [Methylacidiphilum caldifontis]TFE68219.1 prephenate dehydrogenase [Methylacidiphilum caldifontis]